MGTNVVSIYSSRPNIDIISVHKVLVGNEKIVRLTSSRI